MKPRELAAQAKDGDVLEPAQGHQTGRGLQNTKDMETWRALRLFSLEKRRQMRDLTAFYSSRLRGDGRDEAKLFSGSCGNRMRGPGYKRKCEKFHLDTWKTKWARGWPKTEPVWAQKKTFSENNLAARIKDRFAVFPTPLYGSVVSQNPVRETWQEREKGREGSNLFSANSTRVYFNKSKQTPPLVISTKQNQITLHKQKRNPTKPNQQQRQNPKPNPNFWNSFNIELD